MLEKDNFSDDDLINWELSGPNSLKPSDTYMHQ